MVGRCGGCLVSSDWLAGVVALHMLPPLLADFSLVFVCWQKPKSTRPSIGVRREGGGGGCLAASGGVRPGDLGRRALSARSPIIRRVFLIANGEFASGGQGKVSESFRSSPSDYLSADLERL